MLAEGAQHRARRDSTEVLPLKFNAGGDLFSLIRIMR